METEQAPNAAVGTPLRAYNQGDKALTQELAGKVAIVTGGSKGLGRASVELFVQEGAKVVIADVDEANGAALAKESGPAARFLKTDVSQPDQVQALVDYAISEFGGLHVMFNNAGFPDEDYRSLLDRDFAQFDKIIHVNLLGVMTGTQFAARHMAKNGGGSIINTSSISGTHAGSNVHIYRVSKAALEHFTKCAALELGVNLIRVNAIAPGNIPTQMAGFSRADGESAETAERLRIALGEARMLRQPLKRQGTPVDIANAALFLASDRSAQVTGLVMPVDGGATAGNVINQMQELMEARQRALG